MGLASEDVQSLLKSLSDPSIKHSERHCQFRQLGSIIITKDLFLVGTDLSTLHLNGAWKGSEGRQSQIRRDRPILRCPIVCAEHISSQQNDRPLTVS